MNKQTLRIGILLSIVFMFVCIGCGIQYKETTNKDKTKVENIKTETNIIRDPEIADRESPNDVIYYDDVFVTDDWMDGQDKYDRYAAFVKKFPYYKQYQAIDLFYMRSKDHPISVYNDISEHDMIVTQVELNKITGELLLHGYAKGLNDVFCHEACFFNIYKDDVDLHVMEEFTNEDLLDNVKNTGEDMMQKEQNMIIFGELSEEFIKGDMLH